MTFSRTGENTFRISCYGSRLHYDSENGYLTSSSQQEGDEWCLITAEQYREVIKTESAQGRYNVSGLILNSRFIRNVVTQQSEAYWSTEGLNYDESDYCTSIDPHMGTEDRIKALKGQLIVSCQALPQEPLHSSFIMGRMARAAKEGGAAGIRANTKEDIKEIQEVTGLPIIGIVKRDYPDSAVYITPTMKEIEELMEVKPEIVAIDATGALRPGNVALADFFHQIKEKYPEQKLMADCSTIEEAFFADELGFDFIGTTMVGYTPQSRGMKIEANDFEILRTILKKVKHPVIAEGNVNSPEKAKRVIELGSYAVVVGSSITRPQLITKGYAEAVDSAEK